MIETATICPVCHAAPGKGCIGVDFYPLPFVHGERTTATPLFDELQAAHS